MNSAPKESPLFARLYDFTVWLVQKAERFPKAQRFILASHLIDKTFALHAKLIEARKVPPAQRATLLLEADVLLEEVRFALRLALEIKCLDMGAYEHGARLLSEVGRLLGAWIKQPSG